MSRTYYADFKERDGIEDFPCSRKKWDKHRDLTVTFPAEDMDAARTEAFRIAEQFLVNPFIDKLEELA